VHGGWLGGGAYADKDILSRVSDSPQFPIVASPSLTWLGCVFLSCDGVVFGIVPAWITSHSDPDKHCVREPMTRDRASLRSGR